MFIPSVPEVRAHIKGMQDECIGVFRQFSQQILTSDTRVIGYDRDEFDEDCEYYWRYGAVLRFGTVMTMRVLGTLTPDAQRAALERCGALLPTALRGPPNGAMPRIGRW